MKRKSILVAPVLAILLNTSLNAEQFSISNLSLKQAIEEISKKSNMPYMVDGKLLDGKKAPNINNVEGVENALNEILKDTNLKATIEDGTILIREKAIGQGTVLEPISVNTGKSGSAEAGYLTDNITGVGLWGQRSLQDTPYSMNVISQELIENTQANTMAQIFKMNPLTQDGGDRPTGNYVTVIRGFNSNNAVINGMPLADFYSFTTMEDLESVETISGATGFLYGGGRVGGAVNYVTKKPTLEDKKSIKIGNYGGEQYYTHIDLSGQIDEKNIFGYRINALYQDGDSVNDIGKEQKFASITFDFKPTDNFTMDLNYAHRDLKRTKQKLSISLSDSDSVRPILDVSKNYSPDWNKTTETNDRVMPSIKWDINDIFTLRSSLLYEKSDSKTTGDTLAYIRPDGLYDIENTKYSNQPDEFENYAGNVYLDSKFETLGVNHLLTLGYSENYYKYSIARNWFEYEDFYGIALNEIKNLPIPSAIVENSEIIPSTKTQYKNILIGDDIVFNDQWSTLVGFNYATVVQTSYDDGVKSSKYDKSELTPTLSLMYKPFEDLTTYVTYIESLEQGTIVGTQYSNANQVLDPLVSKQYEVGAKYSLLDEKLLLTSALFRIEKANQYSDNATPKPKYVQDGEQIHQGMELTATGKVIDNLTIFGGGTLMDIEVEKSNDKALEGKKPINAASKMAKLYAEYNIPQISGLTVTGGAYYTGKKYVDRLNTDILPSYTLYDAGLRYKTKLDKYPTTFLLNVSNLTGEDYWASNFYLGDPRSVAVSMKMEF
ncbi:TonB-dependent siderophore receptor [Aliarcobacter butzleri]|uniref:TonB-dependent siderophore receptor n=1 Tax=Aliarcobacter butzleri TaxID=28197 RepID=UPI001EDB52F9|nr:TonB-dependent siderophore receptor [Aliarcobacter butzleri]MCG3691418.1 TonB-dependent siderophore receptor [Aliarcobacter butzleri]